MVQTLSVYYGIDWNWSGIVIIGIGIELPSKGFCTGVGIELELLPELELNCKNGIDPDSGHGGVTARLVVRFRVRVTDRVNTTQNPNHQP